MRSNTDIAPNSALSPNSPKSVRGISAEFSGSLDSSVLQSNSARIVRSTSPPLQTSHGASSHLSHSSSRHVAISPQRRVILASPSTQSSLDSFNVLQLLERELAAERTERRDEVSFIAKTYEKEVEVWKGRTRCASQRLGEERKVFEQDVGALDSKLAVALEKARWYEERVQRLEDEMAKRDRSVEEAHEVVRRVETTAIEAARDREVERHRDREITQQENERLSLQLQRVEHDAREAARNATKEELAAQRSIEAVGRTLKNAESATRDLQQEGSRILAEMRFRETQSLAQVRREAEDQVALSRAEVVHCDTLHKDTMRTHAETRQQAEATLQKVELGRSAERKELEDQLAELRMDRAQLVERGAVALDAARVEHQTQVAKLQARLTELVEEKLQAQSTVDHIQIMHEHAEQAWELRISEAGKRFDEMRDGKKEFDIQREQTLLQESEAATLRRLEITWLRTELEDLRTRTTQDLDEVRTQRSRETEYHEVRERIAAEEQQMRAIQVRELEAKLSEAEIEHVRLKASLTSVEKEEARSSSALDFLRPELAACEAIAQKERDARKSEDATVGKLRGDLLIQVQEVDRQKSEIEVLRLRVQSEIEESESARLHALHEHAQLEIEMQHLSRSYRQEQLRVSELDGSMRQHLELIDREVSDLCSLRAVLASADGHGGHALANESVDIFLNSFTLPESPTRHFR